MLDADEQQSVTLRRPTADAFKPPKAPPRTVPASSNMKPKIEKALKTDFSHMFQWSQDEGEKNMLDRKAFLLYHPVDNQAELELMTRWLWLNHVEVSNAHFEGAWEQYAREHVKQKSNSGILVVSLQAVDKHIITY
jgi:chromo domain-containing protein 1